VGPASGRYYPPRHTTHIEISLATTSNSIYTDIQLDVLPHFSIRPHPKTWWATSARLLPATSSTSMMNPRCLNIRHPMTWRVISARPLDEDEEEEELTGGTQGTEVAATQEEDESGQMGSDGNLDVCTRCHTEGELVCCDGCPGAYHCKCVGLAAVLSGDWLCPQCCNNRRSPRVSPLRRQRGAGGGAGAEGGGGGGAAAAGAGAGAVWAGVEWNDDDMDVEELERATAEAERMGRRGR